MPAVPKLGVRRGWFSTASARATIPTMHSATGAVVFDEESGHTVCVRVVGRVVTITPADARADSVRLELSSIPSRYWTKPSKERKVTIHTDHSDQFDPTRAVAAQSGGALELRPESPLFIDESQRSASECRSVDLLSSTVDAAREPCADIEQSAHQTHSSVRALHARLLCLGQTVPGLLARVASAAFECVGPTDQTALGEAYFQLLQDALSSHGAARRIYAEQCAYNMLT
jgi:hypothetical protein